MSGNPKDVSAAVLMCIACGKPTMTINRWYKGNKATLTCSNCATQIVVQNALVSTALTLDTFEVQALEQAAQRPPANFAPNGVLKEAKEKKPKTTGEWVTWPIRVTLAQREVMREAVDLYKRVAGITGKVFAGTAFEHICADFVAGNTVRRVVNPKHFKRDALEKMKDSDVTRMLIYVFVQAVNRLFSTKEDKIDWIVENVPDELLAGRKAASDEDGERDEYDIEFGGDKETEGVEDEDTDETEEGGSDDEDCDPCD